MVVDEKDGRVEVGVWLWWCGWLAELLGWGVGWEGCGESRGMSGNALRESRSRQMTSLWDRKAGMREGCDVAIWEGEADCNRVEGRESRMR